LHRSGGFGVAVCWLAFLRGSTLALVDRAARNAIIDELLSHHPTGGAVFGLEFARLITLEISVDDGSPALAAGVVARPVATRTPAPGSVTVREYAGEIAVAKVTAEKRNLTGNETVRGRAPGVQSVAEILQQAQLARAGSSPAIVVESASVQRSDASDDTLNGVKPVRVAASLAVPEIPLLDAPQPVRLSPSAQTMRHNTPQMGVPVNVASGEISSRASAAGEISARNPSSSSSGQSSTSSGEIASRPTITATAVNAVKTAAATAARAGSNNEAQSRGAIMSVGSRGIGVSNAASGVVSTKVAAGGKVLVQGSNGLMQAAVVKQLLSGYYELEVGSTGETMWVPMANVVPQ
jgi:hypothetical protein